MISVETFKEPTNESLKHTHYDTHQLLATT